MKPSNAPYAALWPSTGPTKRSADVSLLDAMTSILWRDDGQIDDPHIRESYDKANPRVELELFEL